MNQSALKNIGFISTRFAGTDGVSLETAKWAEVLGRNRFECFYFAGELDRPKTRSHKVELAHFEHPEIEEIQRHIFGHTKRSREISAKIQLIKDKLKEELYAFKRKFHLDLIIPENALTIPMNIPLGLAIAEFIAETGIPAIAHHHDFYWERDRFLITSGQDYLDKAFPCDLPSMQHVVINSLASKQLSRRLGISNTVVPNVYDFANRLPEDQKEKCTLKQKIGLHDNDIFILQPTRIVPRKWIERSIEIVRNLELPNPALVISHSAGDEGDEYFMRIREYADNMGVNLILIDHLIGAGAPGDSKSYTIADAYKCADLITYPSGYEGFGNAFLETIYYQKPIVVNRYSIFIADIEPKGFDVITIEGFAAARTIRKIKKVLSDEEYRRRMVEQNYELAEKYFSYEVLENRLLHLIDRFESY